MSATLESIIFIVNPNSGKKNSTKLLAMIRKEVSQPNIFLSTSIQAFNEFFATEAIKYKTVVICGGDGTVNSVIKHLINRTNLTLAILPNGSGDGFAKELGFKKNLKKLINRINSNELKPIDIIEINGEYSCNMIGLGLDSLLTHAFEQEKTRGLKTYIKCTIKNIFKYKPITATIHTNGKTITGKYLMINIANTRQFGNNAIIAPEAKYDDGLMDIILVKPIPTQLLPHFIFKMFNGKLTPSKYVQFLQAETVQIQSNSTTYHIDGEPRNMTNDLNITIKSQQIAVV